MDAYRVQVGALQGLLEGPVMRSDLVPQTEGNEQLTDLVPVSIEDGRQRMMRGAL